MSNQEHKKIKKMPLFLNMVTRVTLFTYLFLIILFVLFYIGNKQGFLDDNLVIILNVILTDAIILAIFSVAGFFGSIHYAFYHKDFKYIFGIINFLICIISSAFFAIFSGVISVLSNGIGI